MINELELQKLMRLVAEKNGVSVEEVAKEIQATIDDAYKNPTSAALLVPRKNDVPTINEVTDFLSSLLLLKNLNGNSPTGKK